MGPKQAIAEDSNSILILCHLMSTCTEFKVDLNAMSELLGIAQAKNVPRRINGIINPHGFELKYSKIIAKESDASAPATPMKSPNSAAAKALKLQSTKTPAGHKKPAAHAAAAKKVAVGAVARKRSANEMEVDDNDSTDEDSSDVPLEKKAVTPKKQKIAAKNGGNGALTAKKVEEAVAQATSDDITSPVVESVEETVSAEGGSSHQVEDAAEGESALED